MGILDYLVIGAGPAGLQLGYFFEQSDKSYLILERADAPGHSFKLYPRHRQLISINKVNTGFSDSEMNYRWDWNSLLNDKVFFPDHSQDYFPDADSLCDYLEEFAQVHNIKVRYGFSVDKVKKNEGLFEVTDEQGNLLKARRLIVATGFNRENELTFPGSELVEPYSKFETCPQSYKNQRVLILGKGNSAFETADSMVETAASIHLCSANPVKLAWETHYVGNVRAVNNNFLDTYQLKSQNVILDAEVTSISKEGERYKVDILYSHAKGETRTIYYDRVLSAVGFKFDDSMFDENCKPERCAMDKFPALDPDWRSKNVPDLYFAGVLMHSLDYRKTMSGFIHGFRYNVQALANILDETYHGIAYQGDDIDLGAPDLAKFVAERITRASSMFLQPGFFGDVLIEKADGGLAYMNDVPLMYFCAREAAAQKKQRFFTISLEYGDWSKVDNPFAIDRDPAPHKAHEVEYIHPIIREYQGDKLIAEFHLPEDLENVYTQPQFEQLLQQHFSEKFSALRADAEQMS